MFAPGDSARPLTVFRHEPRVALALAGVGPPFTSLVRILAPFLGRFRIWEFIVERSRVNPLRCGPFRAFDDRAPGVHGFLVDVAFRGYGEEEQSVASFRFERDAVLGALGEFLLRVFALRLNPLGIRERGFPAFFGTL